VSVQQVRFVLSETSHPGNVGAAARAIKTMGFDQLVLSRPACVVGDEARARASGAADVLDSATTTDSLAEAVADCALVIGASARRRTNNWPELNPRECAARVAEARQGGAVALVFGPERAGLSNADLDLCNALVYIPSNPDYNSLNLAMAVQLIAYELRLALIDERPAPSSAHPPATAGDMQYFYEHLERVLLASGFLDAGNPRHLMRRLRRVFNRAELDANELNILRGMLSALVPGSGKRDGAQSEKETDSS
jgi:TrmH family RNA methyltransferase